jgi:hypothetical protein
VTSPTLLILAALLLSGAPLLANYQTITTDAPDPINISIPAGQVLEIVNFTNSGPSGSSGTLDLLFSGITQRVATAVAVGSTSTGARGSTFVGPATLQLHAAGGGILCLTHKLFDNSTDIAATAPSNSVVIPADAAGPVQIILESSTDLITWTAANPGTYGSSTSKRFFRVRAVR